MASTGPLENQLADIFINKAPKLPPAGKKALVQYVPWISLIIGLLTLYTAWIVWHWAHVANALVNYANTLSQAITGANAVSNRLTAGIWLSVVVLFVEALLYLFAYPGLKAQKKSGWNLLYYGALVNIVYGVVIVFTNYGSLFNLVESLVGSAIGLWLLFQIRSSYAGVSVGNQSRTPVKPTRNV